MEADIISRLPLFATLPQAEIKTLVQTLQERSVPPGEILFAENAASDHFFIILDGEAEIVKSLGTEEERVIAQNGRGSMLGEMSLFSREGTHTASVRARTPLRLLEMTMSQFDVLLHRQPDLAFHLLRLFSARLEESESLTIRDLREKNQALTQAYQELKAAQAQMLDKKRLEHELEIAGRFQHSILPQSLPELPGYDIGALMVPAQAVGGDFYDFIPLGEHRLGIVIGDVCDKGLPAALFMTLSYSAVRTEAARGYTPGDALRAVNRQLLDIANSGSTYVTLLYGILDAQAHTFTYARAAHPHPLVLDRANQAVPLPSSAGQPIGLFDDPLLDEQIIALPPGGTMLLFSDGLSESLGLRNRRVTVENLCYALMEGHDLSAQDLCSGLWGVMIANGHEENIQDDFTIVTIKRT